MIDRFGKVFVKPAGRLQHRHEYSVAPVRCAPRMSWRANMGEVLAEQFIAGPEYTVAILGDRAAVDTPGD